MKEIPLSEDILSQLAIPFGMICQPFATLRLDEAPVHTVSCGSSGPVRCERCRAYINPFSTFIDGGKKYICNLCKCENLAPNDYYCNLDANGRRADLSMRPELCYGTVDLVAPKDYCTRPPGPLSILFMVDVSITAMQYGVTATAIKAIRSYLSSQEGRNAPELVSIITYDRSIHYYTLSSAISMHVITDLEDIFSPLPASSLFVPLSQPTSIPRLLSLLEHVSTIFSSTHVPLSCTGAALLFASKLMERSGGKIIIFQNNLPSFGPGSIPTRDETVILNSPDRDKIMFAPQHDYYQALGESLSGKGISVDLFLCPTVPFIDMPTIGLVSFVTGGQAHCYFSFHPDRDGPSLIRDLQWTLYKNSVFDAMIRVRVGDGLAIREYFGNFYMRSTTDIEAGQIDSDYGFAFSLKYEAKLKEKTTVGIQVAVLYTNREGTRLIRLFNTLLMASANPSNIFKSADLDTSLSILFKSAISHCSLFPMSSLRQQIVERAVHILGGYRKLCSSQSSSGQLVLPDSFKLLPIYTLSMIKSRVLRDGREISLDKRVHMMRMIKAFPCGLTMATIYPSLYALLPGLEQAASGEIYNMHRTFKRCQLSASSLSSDQLFLLETGVEIFLWIGSQLSGSILMDLFGAQSVDQIPVHLGVLPSMNTSASNNLRDLVTCMEMLRQRSLPVRIVRQQHDQQEAEFLSYMLEDKGHGGTDYLDFLCYLHNLIQQYLAAQ